MAHRVLSVVCVIWVSLSTLTGCASRLKLAAVGSFVQDVSTATARHDDVDLAVAAVPTYLLMLEGLLISSPNNTRLLVGTAQMYMAYGSLLEADAPERAARAYAHARQHAIHALRQDKRVAELLDRPYAEFCAIIPLLHARDVPVVFTAAGSWGAWIGAHAQSMAALADLPKVILLMEWVLETDETYLNGSPHLFLGMYHAARPPAYGGRPEESRAHFLRAIEISHGQNLMAKVLMARTYARQAFDRELFVSLLQEVLDAAPDADPELTLQNAAAQRQARRLLDNADEYF